MRGPPLERFLEFPPLLPVHNHKLHYAVVFVARPPASFASYRIRAASPRCHLMRFGEALASVAHRIVRTLFEHRSYHAPPRSNVFVLGEDEFVLVLEPVSTHSTRHLVVVGGVVVQIANSWRLWQRKLAPTFKVPQRAQHIVRRVQHVAQHLIFFRDLHISSLFFRSAMVPLNPTAVRTLLALRRLGGAAPIDFLLRAPTPKRMVNILTEWHIHFSVAVGICASDPGAGRSLMVVNPGHEAACQHEMGEAFQQGMNDVVAILPNTTIMFEDAHLARRTMFHDGRDSGRMTSRTLSVYHIPADFNAVFFEDDEVLRKMAPTMAPSLRIFDTGDWCAFYSRGMKCASPYDVTMWVLLTLLVAFLFDYALVVLEKGKTCKYIGWSHSLDAWIAGLRSTSSDAFPADTDATTADVVPNRRHAKKQRRRRRARQTPTVDDTEKDHEKEREKEREEEREEEHEREREHMDMDTEAVDAIAIQTTGSFTKNKQSDDATTTTRATITCADDYDASHRGAQIIDQIHFYFQPTRLQYDRKMCENMNSDGYIPLELIMAFDRMVEHRAFEFDIPQLMKRSKVVEFNQSNTHLRCKSWR